MKPSSKQKVRKVKAWAALDTPTHRDIVPFADSQLGGPFRVFPTRKAARTANNEKGAVVRCVISYLQ